MSVCGISTLIFKSITLQNFRRLKEVRGQLDQLRSLVQYYQDQRDELEPVEPEASTQAGQARGAV